MLNRAEILGRLHLFLAERRNIVVLKVPQEETEEARLKREAEQAVLDADYLAWQMSPEPQVVNVEDVDRFLAGFNWLIEQVRPMDETEMTDEEIMLPFYDAAKMVYGEKGIRQFFRYAYIILFHSESGPRWSQTIRALGVDGFLRVVEEKTSSFN